MAEQLFIRRVYMVQFPLLYKEIIRNYFLLCILNFFANFLAPKYNSQTNFQLKISVK